MSAVLWHEIKSIIGNSVSKLHENIRRLEDYKLIQTNMVYKEKKQKIISPMVLCVTKNPKYKTVLKKFFQGIS